SAAAPIVVEGRAVAALGIVLASRRSRELPRLVDPLLETAAHIARACETPSS
ncbi:MAG: IclR family transcriptional regulator, partial [Nonomuraea sp.]|nr:IclR family transcriptional regulator [Nonomuraea sp.]